MAVMTDFRAALKAQLTTLFPDVSFVDGRLLGGINNTRAELGCIFPERETESEDTTYVDLMVYVRMYKRLGDQEMAGDVAKTLDPAVLEGWADTLRQGLDDIQGPSADDQRWFFRVSEVEYDMDSFALQATVRGVGVNQFRTF